MRKAILITPVIPNKDGIGIEQRAYNWYHFLKKKYDLDILVIENGPNRQKKTSINENIIFFSPETQSMNLFKRMILTLTLLFKSNLSSKAPFMTWIPITNNDKKKLKTIYTRNSLDLIFCFRIFISEYAFFISRLSGCTHIELDFDDYESLAKKSLSLIHLKNLKIVKAIGLLLSSFQFYKNESSIIKKGVKIFVAADFDRHLLLKRFKKIKICTFENRIIKPQFIIPKIKNKSNIKLQLLFIGALNYYPNEDAIKFFINEVLEDLNTISLTKWELHIAGKNCPGYLAKWLNKQNNVVFHGEVADLSKLYDNCDIVVIPLRGGGGSKIKTIEAVMHSKPIISSSEGVRGLNLKPWNHYYPADTKKEWIRLCQLSQINKEKTEKMAQNAFSYLSKKMKYSCH